MRHDQKVIGPNTGSKILLPMSNGLSHVALRQHFRLSDLPTGTVLLNEQPTSVRLLENFKELVASKQPLMKPSP
jgi:hypothetical protein